MVFDLFEQAFRFKIGDNNLAGLKSIHALVFFGRVFVDPALAIQNVDHL